VEIRTPSSSCPVARSLDGPLGLGRGNDEEGAGGGDQNPFLVMPRGAKMDGPLGLGRGNDIYGLDSTLPVSLSIATDVMYPLVTPVAVSRE
jgi:hypothetical protein